MPSLTHALKKEYETLYATMIINPDRVDDADKIIDKMVANKAQYKAVSKKRAFLGLLLRPSTR